MSATESFWAELPLGRGVTVLVRDENGLAALNKPAGLMSHPNEPGDEPRALLSARYNLEEEVFEWTAPDGAVRRLWLLNRLDSATSGVILVAATAELAAEIRAHFKRKQVRKIYHALVFGAPSVPGQFWRDRLAVERKGGKVRASTGAGHVLAESRMTVLRLGVTVPRTALVRLEPRTGRTHQLRVQCAKRGMPIVGDQTYGDFARNREFARRAGTKRLFLHSSETAFDYEFRGRTNRFEAKAPVPDEFERNLWLDH